MEISDLINIGRLKFSHKNENKDRLLLNLKTEFQHILPKLENVFLIFKDHRVRYGKIDIIKILSDNKAVVSIKDTDILDELSLEDKIDISLDEDEINSLDDSNCYYDPVGMKVIWNTQVVAIIKDFFFNGAHYVYEIEMTDKQLFMIPDVEAFVVETNTQERFIRVVNLDQFMNL